MCSPCLHRCFPLSQGCYFNLPLPNSVTRWMKLICCLFTLLLSQFFALSHEILALYLSKKGLWILKVLCTWRAERLPRGGYAQESRHVSWLKKSKCLKGKRYWVGSRGNLELSMFWAIKLQHRLAPASWTIEQLFLLNTATIPFSHIVSGFWNHRAKLKISFISKQQNWRSGGAACRWY